MFPDIHYRITHRTHYRYSEPVAVCQNQLRMQPRTRPGVICRRTDVKVLPVPEASETHDDYFGNLVYSFAIESLHRALTVTAQSVVTVSTPTRKTDGVQASWEEIAQRVRQGPTETSWLAREFCFDSPRVTAHSRYAKYASVSFTPKRPILEAISELTQRINEDFAYDPSATHVHTETDVAFANRAGVCQDFAHIQIACLRSIGLPARYVSGYLRTSPPPGRSRLVGADQSHAWISVFAGDEFGWIDCDPTNAGLTGSDHIPICIGRDYGDVSPMRGVVLGGGQTTLKVSVDVDPIDASEFEPSTATEKGFGGEWPIPKGI